MPYLIAIAVIVYLVSSSGDHDTAPAQVPIVTPSFTPSSYSSGYESDMPVEQEEVENTMDRDTAIQEHWDEIRQHMNGSETVEACSSSGCYDLDTDISSGNIDQVHFPNGGYLSPDEEISNDGSASSYDNQGRSWDYNVDMNSSTVDDAVQEWADENGVTVD